MKLYNPFKAHFCQFGTGEFGMRKLTTFGWQYLDTSDMHFWDRSDYSGSRFGSLHEAKLAVAAKVDAKRRARDTKKSWRVS
jgi:hypothetical protein